MTNLYVEFAEDLKQRDGSKVNTALTIELLEIAKKVHYIDTSFCNIDFTDRQRTHYEYRRDKLINRANTIAHELGALQIYHQGDPRGWPLYLIFEGDIPKGEEIDSWYNRGLSVPPRRN